MPQNDFYTHMSRIAYPLQERDRSSFSFSGKTLDEAALVDAGFLLGIDADYDEQMRIKLIEIASEAGNVIKFKFRDMTNSVNFIFTCHTTDPEFTMHEVDAVEGAIRGSAFLVTGKLTGASFPVGVYAASYEYYVERALVQSLNKSFVKTVTTASEPGTQWNKPIACGGGSDSHLFEYVTTATDLVGDIRFSEGYNASIRIIEADNTIEFGAVEGGGVGSVCDPVELVGAPVGDTPTLCKDVINTINGVIPDVNGNFYLRALSGGLRIIPDTVNHKVVVDFQSGSDSPYCKSNV